MIEHGERQHAKYSGTGIKRSRKCQAWARYARVLGRSFADTGPDAEEGTKVHELLEAMVRAWESDQDYPMDHEHATEDRLESVSYVLNYLESLLERYPDLQVWVEKKVYFPQTVVPREDAYGMADVLWYSPSAKVGGVIDYKNGVTAVDHPEHNDQVWYYGTAAFWDTPLDWLTLTIIQPNWAGDIIREFTAPASAILDFQADIQAVLLRCEAADATLTPGSWCDDCANGAECDARERAVVEALTGKEGRLSYLLLDELPAPEGLDPGRWADIKNKAAFVRSWLNDIDSAAFTYARGGGNVPGYKVVEAGARRQWRQPPEHTANALAAITGAKADAFLSVEVVGITKAEAAVKKAAKKAANPDDINQRFADLTAKVSSGNLSLAPVTDPRPVYNTADVFTGVVPADLIGD